MDGAKDISTLLMVCKLSANVAVVSGFFVKDGLAVVSLGVVLAQRLSVNRLFVVLGSWEVVAASLNFESKW